MPKDTVEQPRVLLDKVHIQGYKSIDDLTVTLSKGLNILIGKNGAGKSNFLEVIQKITNTDFREQALYKFATVEYFSTDKHRFKLEYKRNTQRYLDGFGDFDDIPLVESIITIDDDILYTNNVDEHNSLLPFKGKVIRVGRNLLFLFRRLGYNWFAPLYIKFSLPQTLGCIDSPGSMQISKKKEEFWEKPLTVGFLNDIFLHLENSDTIYNEINVSDERMLTKESLIKHLSIHKYIIDNLKTYTPVQDLRFNENINIYPEGDFFIVENLKLDFKVNNTWLPWSQLSDGTRRLFYIVSEVSFRSSSLILIEEPELGVHPHQFNLLMDFLKEQSEDKQIIISTHSPKALDHLNEKELDQILIASYTSKKGTQVNHLTPAQKKKATAYMKKVGFLSDYWMLSDLEK